MCRHQDRNGAGHGQPRQQGANHLSFRDDLRDPRELRSVTMTAELVPVDERWQTVKSLARKAVRSPNSIRAYDHALEDFKPWHASSEEKAPLLSKASVNAYRAHLEQSELSSSAINV